METFLNCYHGNISMATNKSVVTIKAAKKKVLIFDLFYSIKQVFTKTTHSYEDKISRSEVQ